MADDGTTTLARPVTMMRAVTDFLLVAVALVATMVASTAFVLALLFGLIEVIHGPLSGGVESEWSDLPPESPAVDWLAAGAFFGALLLGVLFSVWLLRFSMRRQAAQKHIRA